MPSVLSVLVLSTVVFVSTFVFALVVMPSGELTRLTNTENGIKLVLTDGICLLRKKGFRFEKKSIFGGRIGKSLKRGQ